MINYETVFWKKSVKKVNINLANSSLSSTVILGDDVIVPT